MEGRTVLALILYILATEPSMMTITAENGLLSDFQRVVLCLVLCPERFATCCDWLLGRMISLKKPERQMLRIQVIRTA
eukprot:scaffold257180_cov43-Prasinocladus_malaysianus.AAC.1